MLRSIPIWLFPATIAVLEALACLRYAWAGQYRIAIVWGGVAVSNFAFMGIKQQ